MGCTPASSLSSPTRGGGLTSCVRQEHPAARGLAEGLRSPGAKRGGRGMLSTSASAVSEPGPKRRCIWPVLLSAPSKLRKLRTNKTELATGKPLLAHTARSYSNLSACLNPPHSWQLVSSNRLRLSSHPTEAKQISACALNTKALVRVGGNGGGRGSSSSLSGRSARRPRGEKAFRPS